MKAWQHRKRIDETKFRAYLTRILINECHNIGRKRARVVVMKSVPEQAAEAEHGLRTYATLNLTFDESVPIITRNEIASDYMDGLGVPEGRLDAVAGEGEEIVMPRTGKWSEDGLVYTIEMNSNPREQYPDTMVYCPRWGMHDYDWEGDMPPLSMDGAIVMRLKEVR